MKLCLVLVFLLFLIPKRKYNAPVIGGDQLIDRSRLLDQLSGLCDCLGIARTVKGAFRHLVCCQALKAVDRVGHNPGYRGGYLNKGSSCLLHDAVQVSERIKIRILQHSRLQRILQVIGVLKFLVPVAHGKGRKLAFYIA